MNQHSLTLAANESLASPTGFSALGGYVGSPVFSLGEETFIGRQHLPLIRARLS